MKKSFELASTFITVVDCQGFSKAARKLNIAPSVVTRRINLLEDNLQIQLLIRTTRKLQLTNAGERFYQQAKQFHQQWQSFYHDLQDSDQRSTEGKIIVVASPTFSSHRIKNLLFQFTDKYPKIDIEYYLSFAQVDLHTENVDIVIGPNHMLRDTDDIIARKLGTLTMGVYAAPSYLKQHGEPKELSHLQEHAAILWKKQFDRKTAWNFPEHKLISKTRFTTNNEQLALEAAINGLGIIQFPILAAQEAEKKGLLKHILKKAPEYQVDSFLFYAKQRFLPAHIRLFTDFIYSN